MPLPSLARSRSFAFKFPNVGAKPPARLFSRGVGAQLKSEEQIAAVKTKGAEALSPRWLSDLKSRIGKCIIFGLRPEQLQRAGNVLNVVAKEWRDLVAGSEGFLTDPKRSGLERHRIVWGDMDSMQHVNNVTYTRFAESARVNWVRNYALYVDPMHETEWSELWTPKGCGLILRSIRTDYKFPMTWPDRISVYHKLHTFPSSSDDSMILDVIILSERQQRAAARCQEDIVLYDYRVRSKTPLRKFMVSAFQETFRLQEEARVRNTERVSTLLREVKILEKESWDKEDAMEDLGSMTQSSR